MNKGSGLRGCDGKRECCSIGGGCVVGGGVLDWAEMIKIARGIALAVEYMHKLDPPLTNHDLKLNNILLDEEPLLSKCPSENRSRNILNLMVERLSIKLFSIKAPTKTVASNTLGIRD
uniref:Protein kinase domain-containing protein n=1 Tax=Quercus lobata TaxID=97700 RepID=A0A7N2LVY3_QUELO